MSYKRLKRLLNQVIIAGQTKGTFWRKSKKFEIQIYYTPVKNKIMIINIEGVDLGHPKLFLNFSIGDDIDLVYEWVEKYRHEIVFQRNRLQN